LKDRVNNGAFDIRPVQITHPCDKYPYHPYQAAEAPTLIYRKPAEKLVFLTTSYQKSQIKTNFALDMNNNYNIHDTLNH